MRPARDPLRSFVYHAVDRAVRDVFIDGRQAVADGKVLTLDQLDAADRLDRAQHGTIEAAPDRDDRGSTAEAISLSVCRWRIDADQALARRVLARVRPRFRPRPNSFAIVERCSE